MKYILIILALSLLVSCNRFDNSFELTSSEQFEDFVMSFGSDLSSSLKSGDLEPALMYYSNNYLNDGMNKQDVENYFSNLSVTDTVTVDITQHNPVNRRFGYRIYDALVDTTFTEYVIEENNELKIIGNQVIPEYSKVMVELFTATWCSGCPYVEAALSQLKQEYGDRFHYIEYHRMDSLDIGNSDIANYYGLPSTLPIGIINGQNSITGGSASDSITDYELAIAQYFNQPSRIEFKDFSYSITGTELSFELNINNKGSISPDDLVFKYALLDGTTNVNNHAGEPTKNVVMLKDTLLYSENISHSFTLPDKSINYPKLTVWVQTINIPYDSSTSLIHNVAEFVIELEN